DIALIEGEGGRKANLYATIGPAGRPGALLSGHTDVVPVEGQEWRTPPFEATVADGKVFGRGAADMKGFVACALAAALRAADRPLRTPLHLALSYDEEIGCVGVRSMIEMLAAAPTRPLFCIVGEPTLMGVATGHKGKLAAEARCVGREGHSALAPAALNAIHLAVDLVGVIRRLQTEIAAASPGDPDYDAPHTTLHVGRIEGGVALNIVPNHARLAFEIRNLATDDPEALLSRIAAEAEGILQPLRPRFPEGAVEIAVVNRYPSLDTPKGAEVVRFVQALTGADTTMKVAFGTEGGLFSRDLGVPTVVCGPGSMAQGHKADEFVALSELDRCDAMLAALTDRLVEGL
ncbi:MAG: acetylornithine deacetylase, partial [Pseudomonadota bacterium]